MYFLFVDRNKSMAIIPASANLRSKKTNERNKHESSNTGSGHHRKPVGNIISGLRWSYCRNSGRLWGALAEEAAAEIAKENGTELTETDQAEFDEGIQKLDEATGFVGNVALAAGAQGILGLIGCIIAFVALGKGNKAIVGGVVLALAVIASLWAGDFPSIGASNVLHLIAAIMAFIAAPKVMAEA